jgi:hypothetical protein
MSDEKNKQPSVILSDTELINGIRAIVSRPMKNPASAYHSTTYTEVDSLAALPADEMIYQIRRLVLPVIAKTPKPFVTGSLGASAAATPSSSQCGVAPLPVPGSHSVRRIEVDTQEFWTILDMAIEAERAFTAHLATLRDFRAREIRRPGYQVGGVDVITSPEAWNEHVEEVQRMDAGDDAIQTLVLQTEAALTKAVRAWIAAGIPTQTWIRRQNDLFVCLYEDSRSSDGRDTWKVVTAVKPVDLTDDMPF